MSAAARDESFDVEPKATGLTPLQVAVRRKTAILIFAALITMVVGFVVKQMPARYVSSASVMIDLRQPRVSSGESLLPSQVVDIELLRTYMEGLSSPSLARDVVQELGLATAPEYCAPQKSLGSRLSHFFAAPFARHVAPALASISCRISVEDAAKKLAPTVSFSNDGRSYVISISAVAGDAERAADVANAYASAFIERRRQDRAGLTRQADAWLTAHLAQLRSDVQAADNAVQRQRQGSDLTSLQGQTLLAQSLSAMNSQLIVASSDLAQKQSTLQALEDAQHSGAGTVDASEPVLTSPIVQALTEREGILAAAQAEMSTRMGSANAELIANGAELSRVRQQIRTEIRKAVASVSGDVDALQARRASLQARVQELQGQVGEQGIANTRLQDLEREASSARSRYDEASSRLEQIHLDSAMQRADVQLLVEASAPDFPSFPRTRMIVTGTFLAMLGVGAGLAYAMELLSRVFSTPEQVEDQTGIQVLGLFPKLVLAGGQNGAAALANPESREAEAMQAVFAGLISGYRRGDAKGGRVVMVTSALPGEGKTSFSVSLGRAAAARGLSVAMVDCDLRCSTMRNHFPVLEKLGSGSIDDAEGRTEPQQSFAELEMERSTGMHVMIARPRASGSPHAMLASESLPRTLRQLRENHDVIIIDTPPVLAVTDVLSIAPLADTVVMLVGWRQTSRTAVLATLKALRRAHVEISGVVLSKVDLRRFARANGDAGYYARLYPAYHGLTRG